jgi:hypothetical protein
MGTVPFLAPVQPAKPSVWMQGVAWAAKNFVLPLVPFLVGTTTRYISGAHNLFNVGELSFSMAMLCFLVVISAGRVKDDKLRESLSNLWIFTGIFYLTLFAVSTFIEIQIEINADSLFAGIQKLLDSKQLAFVTDAPINEMTRLKVFLDRTWPIVAIPSIPTVLLALACKIGYKLED